MSSSFSPLPSRTPTVRLRDRSPVHVSTMSPTPASPASVSGLAPDPTAPRVTHTGRPSITQAGDCSSWSARMLQMIQHGTAQHSSTTSYLATGPLLATSHQHPTCQARNFVEAARDERGTPVGAKAKPVADATGNGQHVLQRAAQLHPRHVVGAVAAEAWGRHQLLQPRETGAREFWGRRRWWAARRSRTALRHLRHPAVKRAGVAAGRAHTCTRCATASSSLAMVTAVGFSLATSAANEGPLR